MTQGDQAAYIRTLVEGDFAANDDIEARLDAAGWDGWTVFLANCFFSAVDRHFKRPLDRSEVIRFVADLRDWAGSGEPDIDPVLAERLISSVLDDTVDIDGRTIDPEASGMIQLAVVHRILAVSAMSSSEIDAFLAENSRRAFPSAKPGA